MDDYITDCGYPSVLLDPIDCPSCSVCCNAENSCSRQRKSTLQPTVRAIIIFMALVGLLSLIYSLKNRIMRTGSIQNLFEENVIYWQASKMIGEKSVYHFFLTHSTKGWYVGLFCAIAQLSTLFLFINAADIANEGSDLQYTITCSRISLECEDEGSRTFFGGLIFSLILGVWLMKDIVGALKLLMVAMWKKDIDFFFASVILFLVTFLSAWTSAFYNYAIATKDTELIVNAVILLFVNELDERLFQLVQTCNFSFAEEVDESLERISFYDNDQRLNVSRAVNKVTKRLRSLGSSISPSLRPRRSVGRDEVPMNIQSQDKNSVVSEGEEPMNLDLGKETEQ